MTVLLNRKGRDSYANFSLNWYVYNPQQKDSQFQPSLFLSREVGAIFSTALIRPIRRRRACGSSSAHTKGGA